MSLNAHLEQTPDQGNFTLESLGLTTDPIGPDGVLDMKPDNAPTAVIQTDMRTPGTHDTSLDSKEIAEIPSWNNRVCVMTDTANKIVDMVEIQKDIEGVGLMSADKSHVIEATFENFYSASNPKSMYSQQETKVNYQSACAFMNKRIKATTEALVTQFREVNTTGMAEMAEDVLKAREYCVDELRDIINDSVNKVVAIKDIVLQGPVILPFNGDIFIDMMEVDLSTVDLDQIKQGVPLTQEFRDNFAKLKQLWMNQPLRACLSLITECQDAPLAGEAEPVLKTLGDGLTARFIVAIVGMEVYRTYYQQSIELSEKAQRDLESEMRMVNTALEAGENIHSLISPKSEKLEGLSKQVARIKGDAVSFGEFFQASAAVLLYLISLR